MRNAARHAVLPTSSADLHLYAILLAEVLRDEFDFVTVFDVYDQLRDDLIAHFNSATHIGLTEMQETHLDGLCSVAAGEVDEELAWGFLHYCGGGAPFGDLSEIVEATFAHGTPFRMANGQRRYTSYYVVSTARGCHHEDTGEDDYDGLFAAWFGAPHAPEHYHIDWKRTGSFKHGAVVDVEGTIIRLLVGRYGTLDYRILAERQ